MAKLGEVLEDSPFRSWIEQFLADVGEAELTAYSTDAKVDEPKDVWVATDAGIHHFLHEPNPHAKGYWRSRGESLPWHAIEGTGITYTGFPAADAGYMLTATVPSLGLTESGASDTPRARALLAFALVCMKRQSTSTTSAPGPP